MGVEHVAFVGAVGIGRVAQQKNLSQIAGRGVETSGSCCEGGHLIGFGFGELGVNSAASDLENLTLVPGPGQQAAFLGEGERIDEVVARTPKL